MNDSDKVKTIHERTSKQTSLNQLKLSASDITEDIKRRVIASWSSNHQKPGSKLAKIDYLVRKFVTILKQRVKSKKTDFEIVSKLQRKQAYVETYRAS